MSNLYSVLPGLTPSSQEIIEAELIAKQILEGEYPDLDLREGTGLRDLVLRPTAYAFALLKKATDYYFTQNTLATVDDSTPAEVVDDLLSNWFLSRNTGTQAVISARLFFARSKNVTLTTDIGFSPDNTLYFFPESSQAYPAGSMSYDAYANEWYLDVFMTAADTGTDYNLSEGSLLYFSSFDPYFLRAEINYLVSESSPAETNTEFVSRASSAISTRNLINIPSVDSRLRQTFNYLNRVTTVGAGDPSMIRDMIQVWPQGQTQAPVQATGASFDGANVFFTVQGHRFQAGQKVTLSEALPSVYNGDFIISSITEDSIELLIEANTGYVSSQPYISLFLAPVYVHNGGAVDVYCGDRLSTRIVQLSTDSSGTAKVYGPVYSLSRSLVSGGDAEDTIPAFKTVPVTSYYANTASKTLVLQASGNTLLDTSSVEVSGILQYHTVQALSCVGVVVTATLVSGHGIEEGSTVEISGVTPAAYNGVFTVTGADSTHFSYEVPSQISGPGAGQMKASNPSLTLGAYVLSSGNPEAVLLLPGMWSSAFSSFEGTIGVEQTVDYQATNPYLRSDVPCTIEVQGSVATLGLYNHGMSVGRRLNLKDTPSASLDGTWVIDEVPSGSQVRFDVSSAGVFSLAQANAVVGYVTNSEDVGFSARQILEVDFGSAYANQTASFELSEFKDVESVQDYLDSPDNRVLCGDYLARGYNITLLDVEVVSYGLTAYGSATVQSAATAYLSSLEAGAPFVLSDLVSAFYQQSITNIRTPVGVKYTRYTRDLTAPEEGVVLDYLDPADKTNVFLLRTVTSNAAPL